MRGSPAGFCRPLLQYVGGRLHRKRGNAAWCGCHGRHCLLDHSLVGKESRMTASHWMQIAALASGLAMTGAAIAQDTDPSATTGNGVSAYGMEAPLAGAIVTPEDKASGMGKKDVRDQNGVANEDAQSSSGNMTNDASSVHPGPANDDESSVNLGPANDESINPGPANDDQSIINPETSPGFVIDGDDASRRDNDRLGQPGTGLDARPGAMGPDDMRGQ
jgi:hypothetical protein